MFVAASVVQARQVEPHLMQAHLNSLGSVQSSVAALTACCCRSLYFIPLQCTV